MGKIGFNKDTVLEKIKEIKQKSDNLFELDFWVICKNGDYKCVNNRISGYQQEDGDKFRYLITTDITEKKLNEEKIKEQNFFIKHVTDVAPIGIYIADIETDENLWYSTNAYKMLGYSLQEWKAIHIDKGMQLLHPDDKKALIGVFTEPEKSFHGGPIEKECRILHKNGEYQWFHAIFSVFKRNEQAKIIQVLAIIIDIDEKNKSEMLRRESENRFQSLFNSARDAIYTISSEGIVTSLNPAFERLSGWKAEEYLGHQFTELIHPEEHEYALQIHALIQQGISPSIFEHRFKLKSGDYAHVEFSVTPLFKDENIIGTLGIARDVTGRRSTERDFRQTQFVVDNVSEEIFGLNQNGDVIYANNAACQNLEYPAQELLSMNASQFVLDFSVEGLAKWWDKLLLQETATIESVHRTKSGKLVTKESTLHLFKIGNLHICYVFSRDITVRKNAEKALLLAEERYRELFNNSLIGIYRTSIDGKVLMANSALLSLLGYKSTEDIQNLNNIHSYKTPEKEEKFKESLDLTGEVIGFEAEWVRFDGNIIFIRESASAIRDTNGEITYIEGTLEDISAYKIALLAIEESEQKFRTLFESSEDAIVILGESHFIDCNNKALELFGYSKEEFLTFYPADVSPEFQDNGERSLEAVKRIVERTKTKGTYFHEWKHLKKSGEPFYADVVLNTTIIGGKGMIQAAIRDITERKETERKLKELYTELLEKNSRIAAQSELLTSSIKELEKLSVVASKTDNSVVIFDKNGEIEWVNEGFTAMLGISLEDFKERYGSNLYTSSLNPDIRQLVNYAIINDESAIYTASTFTKDGRELWIQTTLTPIFDNNRELDKIIVIDADVTKIKMAEFEIMLQKEEIESQRDEIEITNKNLIKANKIIESRNKSIMDSIKYATRIQKAVLQSYDDIQQLFPDSFIYFKPKDIVSGDFFWIFEKQGYILMAVVDCTGHGVPGAFMSIIANNLLNQAVLEKNLDKPSEILNFLNDAIKRTLHNETEELIVRDGMDLAICKLNYHDSTLQYAAVNNSILIKTKNEFIATMPDKQPVGMLFNEFFKGYNNYEYKVEKGDILYLYTDGFFDQLGGPLKRKFLSRQFKETLIGMSHKPLAEQKVLLGEIYDNWKGTLEQVDDVLVMGLRI